MPGGQSCQPVAVRAGQSFPPDDRRMTSTAAGITTPPLALADLAEGRAPKLHRVHDRATHTRLRRARRVRRGPLTVSCVSEADSRAPRVAYAIARGTGGAVRRNRVRRRLRAVMTALSPELAGKAWLVGAGAEVLDIDARALRASAESAISALASR